VPTTNDVTTQPHAGVGRAGLGGFGFALLSASSFGLSGVLGKGLLETGWTAGAAVLLRVTVAALVLAIPTLMRLRGNWGALRRHAWLLVAFGLVPVAGTQFCFFQAVATLPVGIALLLEYTAPVVIIGWLWVRHGHRPSRLTVIGAVVVLTAWTAATMPVLGEIVPFGPTLQTNVVAAVSTSFASRMPLLLVSSPVSILVPPNGQFDPAGSALARTKLFSPLHT